MYGPSVLAIERGTLMAIGRPIPVLRLTDDEREALERWARRPTTAQALAQRARVILACASGRTNTRVARDLRLTNQTVGKWRSRFVAARLDGLLDEPRPGAPRRISDAQVEHMVTLTLEATPREATHWSTRAMATRCGLSQSTVSRIWRAFGLQPHRTEAFKLSKDPLFVEKVRDIVGLYLNPPTARWSCAPMKSRRFRRWIAHSRCCPCGPAKSNGAPTTMCAMARRRSSRPWTSRPVRSSAAVIAATGPWSFASSSTPSMRRSPRSSTFIWSSTTTPRTRRRSSGAG